MKNKRTTDIPNQNEYRDISYMMVVLVAVVVSLVVVGIGALFKIMFLGG